MVVTKNTKPAIMNGYQVENGSAVCKCSLSVSIIPLILFEFFLNFNFTCYMQKNTQIYVDECAVWFLAALNHQMHIMFRVI